jgi:Arc/MetJ family transcription regulator
LVIDDALFEQARRVLGTRTIKDIIDRALEQVVAMDARRALIRRLESQDGLDLANEEVMRRAWGE